DGLPAYRTVAEGIAAVRPTVVCVTVNESAHAEVLTELAGCPRCLILAEKPLTADLPSAESLRTALAHHAFSMNLVERFSPVVDGYRAWVSDNGPVTVVRAEVSWGKHRLFDPRPTMGVHSELIHGLDLVDHVLVPLSGARWQASGIL